METGFSCQVCFSIIRLQFNTSNYVQPCSDITYYINFFQKMPILLFFTESDGEMLDEAHRAVCLEYQCEICQEYKSKVAARSSNWNWLVTARSNSVE